MHEMKVAVGVTAAQAMLCCSVNLCKYLFGRTAGSCKLWCVCTSLVWLIQCRCWGACLQQRFKRACWLCFAVLCLHSRFGEMSVFAGAVVYIFRFLCVDLRNQELSYTVWHCASFTLKLCN